MTSTGMSPELRLGAIVLNSDCSCVALVKRSASNLWGFPRGGQNGHKVQQAAKQAVRTETGIVLSDLLSTVTFEVWWPKLLSTCFVTYCWACCRFGPQNIKSTVCCCRLRSRQVLQPGCTLQQALRLKSWLLKRIASQMLFKLLGFPSDKSLIVIQRELALWSPLS